MTGTSVAERKAAERARMRKLGYSPMQYWVHKDDKAKVNSYVLALRKRRERK